MELKLKIYRSVNDRDLHCFMRMVGLWLRYYELEILLFVGSS